MPEVTFNCPRCKGNLLVDSRGAGKSVLCPLCKESILIPSNASYAPPQEPDQGPEIKSEGIRINSPVSACIFYEGDKILGRYRVVNELGEGGMGVVYRCVDEIGGIHVALKALPPELSRDTTAMQEVRDNFKLIEKLHHPNIAAVKTLECDPQTGDYYLIMEYVEGRNLYYHRKQLGGRLTVEQALPILRQIAAALDFAHGEKIVHRDIKPANLMVRHDGIVKLLDFGLAAQIHAEHVPGSHGSYDSSGTGVYMAPEQWRGQYQGAATDQYALACTAYELLAGQVPFSSHNLSVLSEAVLNEEPPTIKGVPSHTVDTLRRGLSKDWGNRFPSCGEFIQAFTEKAAVLIPAQVIDSCSTKKSPAKEIRRSLVWAMAASLVAIVGLAAGVIFYRAHQLDDTVRTVAEKQQYLDKLAGEVRALLETGNFIAARQTIAKAESLGLGGMTLQELQMLLTKAANRQEALQRFAEASIAREKALKARRDVFGIPLDQMEVAWRAAEAARLSGAFGDSLSSYIMVSGMSREILEAEAKRNQDLTGSTIARTSPAITQSSNRQISIDLNDGVNLEMVLLPPGEFLMGSPDEESGRSTEEGPPHRVTISTGFWIGKYTITQRQYRQLIGEAPSYHRSVGADAPVENIEWSHAKTFCEKLQKLLPAELRNMTARLPTEAEWEYACRAGTIGPYAGHLENIGWFDQNSGNTTHPVGQKLPNAWGLYDMHGNVMEWCWDGMRIYSVAAQKDPEGLGPSRMVRGGSWQHIAQACRSAYRSYSDPHARLNTLGFRVVVAKFSHGNTNAVPVTVRPAEPALRQPRIRPEASVKRTSGVPVTLQSPPIIRAEAPAEMPPLFPPAQIRSVLIDRRGYTADLGAQRQISGAVINWGIAHPLDYQLLVSSDDNLNWTTTLRVTNCKGGRAVHTFKPVEGRYLRIRVTRSRPTQDLSSACSGTQVLVDGNRPPQP
jgi:formylglycine-generating enzyme required for sulfatase activity